MKALRAKPGLPFTKNERDFLENVKNSFKYDSNVWLKSHEVKDFSKVFVKKGENPHFFQDPALNRVRYMVYNTDQLINGSSVVTFAEKVHKQKWNSDALQTRVGKVTEEDNSDVNTEFDSLIRRIRAMR